MNTNDSSGSRALSSCAAWLFLLSGIPVIAQAQGVIRTLAGIDWLFPGGARRAIDAPLGALNGIAVGPDGAVYVADQENHLVLRIDQSGVLTVVAGHGV